MSGRGQDGVSCQVYDLLECYTRLTMWGPALLVRIHRHDMAPMGFAELWGVLDMHYPDRWAVQAFPPRALLMDQANKYHLWVFEEGVHVGAFDLLLERK